MDNEFKKALSKKSGVRLELIEKLENEFREFFSEKPGGVWTKTESSNQVRASILYSIIILDTLILCLETLLSPRSCPIPHVAISK